MSRVRVSVIRKAVDRLDHASRCIRHGEPLKMHYQLRGHSSDFIAGALWALEWVLKDDPDSGPAGRLSVCKKDPRFESDRLPDGSLPLRGLEGQLPEA